jgi:endonuclease/exonuclease/phosphatase family metal-dependent hydrolase
MKLRQIKKVVDAQGDLPDILTVNEVENVNVVSQLADTLGYPKFLVTSGSDSRIEVAILYKEDKIKLKEMKEIVLSFPQGLRIKKTRNILVANFAVKNKKDQILGVYANHWPSQAAPSGARVTAAQFLKKAIDQNVARYGDNYHVVAMGDFNTTTEDNPMPFDELLDKTWDNALADVQTIYRRQAYKNDPQGMIDKLPEGTYFYPTKNQWNNLDHFFVSRNMLKVKSDIRAEIEHFRIIAPQGMTKTFTFKYPKDPNYGSCVNGVPVKYNVDATSAKEAGFSDHFPIEMMLRL